MPYIDLQSATIYYQVINPHEIHRLGVLLLHGLGSCSEDWLLQVPVFTPHYQVITIDLPGHGRSTRFLGKLSIQGISNLIGELIGELGLPAIHIVGLSLGGLVGLQLAVHNPDLVRSLVVVNAFARLRVERHARLRALGRIALLAFGPMNWMGRWVAEGLFPAEEQATLREAAAERIASNPRLAYLQAMIAAARFDLRSHLTQISTPTLIIAGERDTTVPMHAKRELARAIRGAKFEVIEGSGHATPIDAPQHFNRLVLAFFLELDE